MLATALVGLLAFTALFGLEVDGVRRWIALGPLRLHTGYLVLPLVLALTRRLSSRLATLLVAVAAAATAIQPDLATCTALLAAAAAIAAQRRDWPSGTALAIAVACTAWALKTPDTLLPVKFVEAVQLDALRSHLVLGLILIAATLCPMLLAMQTNARPLAAFLVAAGLCAFAGPYPSILIGYGAAPILGFGLALAALRRQ